MDIISLKMYLEGRASDDKLMVADYNTGQM
jgi:hypothetical protein